MDTDSLTQIVVSDTSVGAKNTSENNGEMEQSAMTASISDRGTQEISALFGVVSTDFPLIECSGARRTPHIESHPCPQISESDRVDQLFEQIPANSKKRQSSTDNDNLKLRKLPRRSWFVDTPEIGNEDCLESLRTLGSAWTDFYQTHINIAELAPDRISHVL